jgi:hypothetical protein
MTRLPESFWAKTTETDCIIWTGATNTKGYGCYSVNGVSQLAHRLAYEDARGRIPADMTIDHLCRVRSCVNPDHMEVVTAAENNRRRFRAVGGLRLGSTCRRGHLLTELNLYHRPNDGGTECRDCIRDAKADRKASA